MAPFLLILGGLLVGFVGTFVIGGIGKTIAGAVKKGKNKNNDNNTPNDSVPQEERTRENVEQKDRSLSKNNNLVKNGQAVGKEQKDPSTPEIQSGALLAVIQELKDFISTMREKRNITFDDMVHNKVDVRNISSIDVSELGYASEFYKQQINEIYKVLAKKIQE